MIADSTTAQQRRPAARRSSSLLTRLLVVSVTIAVTAVITTAWLTTRTTSERIIGEFSRSLEADAFIYSQLTRYAVNHRDWNDVGPLLTELRERTGRRLALATPDGEPLADSSKGDGDDTPPPLPDVPAALIDPIAPSLNVAGDVARPSPSPANRGQVTTGPLTTTERQELQRRAADRETCLDTGRAPVEETTPRSGATATLSPQQADELLTVCNPTDLADEEVDMLLLRQEINHRLASCLEDESLPYAFILDADSLDHGSAPPGPGVEGETGATSQRATHVDVVAQPTDDTQRRAAATCDENARREVLGPYVASAAVLYLGDETDSDGPIAGVGGGQTVGAILLVLVVTIGATVAASRRLVTPLRSLTEAAGLLEGGAHHSRVTIDRSDEIGRLGTAFNTMAATLENNEAQRRAIVSDVAHELRSPLTNLRAHIEAAHDGVIDIDDDLTSSLLDEAVLLQRLVDDLQQLATADAGKLQLHLQPTDAADLLTQVAQAYRANAIDAEVTLNVEAPASLPVVIDPDRLRQAIGNLVANAISYTPRNGTVTLRGNATDEHTVELTVEDTGSGIDPEHLPHLFDRFYRVDSSRDRATGGSGLGLAITRTLIETHGGTISVESITGHGSKFTVRLPASRLRDDRRP